RHALARRAGGGARPVTSSGPAGSAGSAGWSPPSDAVSATNVGGFMTADGIGSLDGLRTRSVDEPEWFWPAVIDFLRFPFLQPFDKVVDTSGGIPWAKWFIGGQLNLADVCVDRWVAEMPERTAL